MSNATILTKWNTMLSPLPKQYYQYRLEEECNLLNQIITQQDKVDDYRKSFFIQDNRSTTTMKETLADQKLSVGWFMKKCCSALLVLVSIFCLALCSIGDEILYHRTNNHTIWLKIRFNDVKIIWDWQVKFRCVTQW